MRLKTKFQDADLRLGEVVDASIMYGSGDKIRVSCPEKMKDHTYNSIKDFTDHWEDALEEPKGIIEVEKSIFPTSVYIEYSTEEEAEKAVEKLKAIEILKNNGFRFVQWEFDMKAIADGKIWFDVGVNTQWNAEQLLKHRHEVKESLDLLFGGEE